MDTHSRIQELANNSQIENSRNKTHAKISEFTVYNVLKDTVKRSMKRNDPSSPPTMVMYSVEPSCCLNICIPANSTTVSVEDRRRDGPVDTAETYEKI